jgi:hypothetical protein
MTGSDMSQSPDATAPAQPAPSPLDNLVASMGTAQLLIVGGAAVLVVVDLLFGVLLREYFIGDAMWLGAGGILLAFLVGRRMPNMLPMAYERVLLVGGLIVAIVGARGIIFDVVSLVRSPSAWNAMEIIGLLAYIAAVLAVAWGVWQLAKGQR